MTHDQAPEKINKCLVPVKSMTEYQHFKIYDNEAEVVLAVDKTVLTPELATEINNFRSSASARLNEQDGDVVLTVVRMFGSVAIAHMLSEGPVHFGMNRADHSKYWTEKVLELEYEGWPTAEGLGIRIVEACVDIPDFFSVEMEVFTVDAAGGDHASWVRLRP